MTRRARLAAVLLGLAITAAAIGAAQPQTSADPLFATMTGRWEGTGTILSQPARVELEWTPTLDGRFARLTWISHIGAAPGTRRFEGHAYYQPTADGYRATWFDSGGMVRPIAATRTADAIVARWGTPETEQGETTYRLTGTDALQVVDRVLGKDGTWREFGRSALQRVR